MWTTKRQLKKYIEELEDNYKQLLHEHSEACYMLEYYIEQYPLTIGSTVYDVALRNEKGRFTKIKPAKEYSTINEVTVTTKNYFNLVDRYRSNDVFKTRELAEEYLERICVN